MEEEPALHVSKETTHRGWLRATIAECGLPLLRATIPSSDAVLGEDISAGFHSLAADVSPDVLDGVLEVLR